MTTQYMLDIVIDGKSNKMMLDAIPATLTARFYRVEQTEALTLLAEKVLK